MNQIKSARRGVADCLVAQQRFECRERFTLRRIRARGVIGFALELCLRNKCIGSLQTVKIVTRVLRAQLARDRRCFREPFLSSVKDDQ